MAGGNGDARTQEQRSVTVLHAQVPPELHAVVSLYQKQRRINTISNAIRELIETHPAIAKIVSDLYNGSTRTPTG